MESTLEFLRRHLKAAGPKCWPQIAEEAGVAASLLRKLAYGDRANPRLLTIEPLVNYFREVESGDRVLPTPPSASADLNG